MKYYHSILFTIFLAGSCFGQSKIQWSPLKKSPTALFETVFLGESIYFVRINTNGFNFSSKGNYIDIYKYGKDLDLEKKTTLDLKYKNDSAIFYKLVSSNEKLWLLSKSKEKLTGDHNIIITEIDKETLLPIGEPSEVLNKKISGVLDNAKFYFKQSPDKKTSLLLCDYQIPPKENKKFSIIFFDENMSVVSNQIERIEHTNKRSLLQALEIDNNKNIFLTFFQKANLQNLSRGIFWSYNPSNKQIKAQEFQSSASRYLKSLKLDISENSVVVGGYYSAEEKRKILVRFGK